MLLIKRKEEVVKNGDESLLKIKNQKLLLRCSLLLLHIYTIACLIKMMMMLKIVCVEGSTTYYYDDRDASGRRRRRRRRRRQVAALTYINHPSEGGCWRRKKFRLDWRDSDCVG